MSDQIKEILDVPREFIKDGIFFLNRCTKPTKQGNLTSYALHIQSLGLTCDRIFVNLEGCRNRISGDGVHWVRCQVDSYPYQQYPGTESVLWRPLANDQVARN